MVRANDSAAHAPKFLSFAGGNRLAGRFGKHDPTAYLFSAERSPISRLLKGCRRTSCHRSELFARIGNSRVACFLDEGGEFRVDRV